MVLITPLSSKLEDFPKPVDTSSQVGALDEGELDDPTPEEVPATYSPTIKTPGPNGNVPPLDIAHLWGEANKALGDWLAVKSSIDACQQKLVSEFGMTLHQNESKTEESTKEAKALCTCSIREADTNCAHSIKEAEAHCSTAIREAEALGASQASSFNSHMPRTFSILKKRPSKRRVKVNSTFSLPAKLPWKPVLSNSVACC